jgi:hypothetical protein
VSRTLVTLAVITLVTVIVLPVAAAPGGQQKAGFITQQSSMLDPVMPGVTVKPILTVGDTLSNGYRFESIPDGISVMPRGQGRVDLFVNHETSKVPFPFNTASPSPSNGENDFDNAQVSRIALNQHSAGVLTASYAISSSEGWQRFCSNYLATAAEGFSRDILFTNEEGIDYVFRQEDSWPPPIGDPAEDQIGMVVALDVKNGKTYPIPGMGRHNHENSVPIPGYDDLVVLSGDDTFTSGPLNGVTFPPGISAPAQSQLYSYVAPDTTSLLADAGELWAFVSDDPAFNDYYDFTPGSAASVSGHFIPVPENIATGLNADGSKIEAADVGFPAPPTNGSWQRDLRASTLTPVGLDGPQWVLEYWSDINNVFQFVRVEDIAYDKRPGMENVVYVVDSGRGTAGASQAGRSTNGRVWKIELDPTDPTEVTSLSVFVEGDDNPVKTLTEVRQPDNLETTQNGLLITEDPGSTQQYAANDPAGMTARLWYVPFSGTPQPVVKVNQGLDGDSGVDVDGRPDGNLGAWETSGIVDASAAFGPGAFLIDVQAHSLWVDKADGVDYFGPNAGPPDGILDFTYKREGGQLSLLMTPGL